jgi:hypothetical protein
VLVEGVSHAEARRLYERADLLVDQLLVGWYGALAVELMALGRPVACYIRREDLDVLPPPMAEELPVLDVEPASLVATLRQLLTARRSELPELGRRGRAYVERWHDPRAIAAGMADAYRRALADRHRGRRPGLAGSAGSDWALGRGAACQTEGPAHGADTGRRGSEGPAAPVGERGERAPTHPAAGGT